MSLIPHVVIWAALTTIVVFLAVYRRKVDTKADDMLHVLDGQEKICGAQEAVAKKLDSIDRWGKLLTLVVILYALTIGGLYLYNSFADQTVKVG